MCGEISKKKKKNFTIRMFGLKLFLGIFLLEWAKGKGKQEMPVEDQEILNTDRFIQIIKEKRN